MLLPMTLRLTPGEFRTLLRCMFLARTVVDGAGLDDDTASRDVAALQTTIHAAAANFGAEAMFDGDPAKGAKLHKEEEDTLFSILDWYEDTGFWDNLEERLAMRDIAETITQAQWHWMSNEEKDKLFNETVEVYYNEFSDLGIDNLRLVPPDPDKVMLPPWSENFDPANPDTPAPAGAGGKIIEFPGKRPRKSEA